MTRNPPALPVAAIPRHVAIVMDGNGRWAQARKRPRAFGHRAGVKSVRSILRACRRNEVHALTLFAFSQENWQRPHQEVSLLMELFLTTLDREVAELDKNEIRIRFIGDHAGFPAALRKRMREAEAQTAGHDRFHLTLAVGYGGQWDLVQAAQKLAKAGTAINTESLDAALSTAALPPVDLLIRTGGERRISNFMLWQLAYTELYFCDTLWPDFGEDEFAAALTWFAGRERRFGRVPEAA